MKKNVKLSLMLRLFVCLIMILTAGNVFAATIMSLDGSRTGNEGELGDDRYLTSTAMAKATNLLLSAGFTIGTTDRFTAANIAGASALYTGAVDTAFTSQELTDIAAYVAAGGGLVIQRDWDSFYPAADPLAALFGVSYNTSSYGSAGTANSFNKTADHPIWSGLAGSVSSYNQVYSSSINGGTSIGEHSGSSQTALAYLAYGLGRVVFLSDMDAWDDFGDPVSPDLLSNNAIVWENIFHYASTPVPVPATIILLGSGLIGLPFLRKKGKK